MRRLFGLIVFMLLGGGLCHAGAFQIGEQGAAAQGMANAVTSQAKDASTVWFNPAGMAMLEGRQASIGATGIFVGSHSFSSSAGNASSSRVNAVAPNFYVSSGIGNTRLYAGIGVNAPFGLETKWPSTAPFASTSTFSKLEGLNINPNLAYKLNDALSLAVGVDYFRLSKVHLDTSDALLGGNGDGWGANAALMYQGGPFSFGISYRSRIKVNIKGTASAAPGGGLASFANSAVGGGLNLATSSGATTSITLPDQVNVGMAFHPNDRWLIALDVDWVNWKTFDRLNITYSSRGYQQLIGSATAFALNGGVNNLPASAAAAGAAAPVASTAIPENFRATTAVRLGTEWMWSPSLRIRFGAAYDPTPVGDPTTFSPGIPDNGRFLYSVGVGYRASDALNLDFAYMLVDFRNRIQTASTGRNASRNGSYSIANAHLFAGSVSYVF